MVPVFQYRYYKAIAATLAKARETIGSVSVANPLISYTVDEIADMFASDNPRFDRAWFLAAANGKPSNGRDKVQS